MNIPAKEYIFASIFLLSNKLQALGDSCLREITLKQWLLLVSVHTLAKNPLSVTELAAFTGSSRQNTRKMLEALEGKGYVTLTQNAQDKRNLSVALTAQTHDFFEQFEARGEVFLAQLFEGISPEQLEISQTTIETLFENAERMGQSNE